MTDEELEKKATAWIRSQGWSEENLPSNEYLQMLTAYVAGAKENGVVWHYVKDGLPEELHDVLCFVIHNKHRIVLQGYMRDGRWVVSSLGTYLNNDDVIAWCEVPRFEAEND